MEPILLDPGLPGGKWGCLRSLCGHDEASVDDTSGLAEIALLDRLLVEAPGTSIGPGQAADLTVADRERLLTAVYRRHFGDRIEATTTCHGCAEPFELDFSLSELIDGEGLERERLASGLDEDGVYSLSDGRRFRLPTGRDQHGLLGLPPSRAREALLERCLLEDAPSACTDELEALLEDRGALLPAELEVVCPHCESPQRVDFDIQGFLLSVLVREKRWLAREVHALARGYGWSLHEIMGLSREDRHAYVRLVETERRGAAGGRQ